MSSYEKCDLLFTGLNFLFVIVTAIIGYFVNRKRKEINNDKKEIDKISKEVRKYRDTIINNRDLSNLSIVLEEVKDINKKLDNLVHKEKQNNTRGINIFEEYFNESKKIFEINSKVPSKYIKLEEELDKVRTILKRHADSEIKLSESKKYDDIDLILNNVIKKLKRNIENLNLK